jgi:hypothetical protein
MFRSRPDVVDAVLHLIKMWLECPVEETDDRGGKRRRTEAKDHRRGIPNGREFFRALYPLTTHAAKAR